MTLAGAHLRLMVWCKVCDHRSELDPTEQARWYGAETTIPQWRARLVVSGTKPSEVVKPARDHHLSGMKNLELTDIEADALIQELSGTINYARYPHSPRIQTLRAILSKLNPQPARPAASPEPRVYEPPTKGRHRRRRG